MLGQGSRSSLPETTIMHQVKLCKIHRECPYAMNISGRAGLLQSHNKRHPRYQVDVLGPRGYAGRGELCGTGPLGRRGLKDTRGVTIMSETLGSKLIIHGVCKGTSVASSKARHTRFACNPGGHWRPMVCCLRSPIQPNRRLLPPKSTLSFLSLPGTSLGIKPCAILCKRESFIATTGKPAYEWRSVLEADVSLL